MQVNGTSYFTLNSLAQSNKRKKSVLNFLKRVWRVFYV